MTGLELIDFIEATLWPLSEEQKQSYLALDGLYRDWNAKINVISRKDMDGLYLHHVLHSLSIAAFLKSSPQLLEDFSKASVLDVGTGGGFPGIPLAILFPEANFTLCDSVGKKTIVASAVKDSLGLKNVEVVNCRAESLGKKYDFIVSRAVASLNDFHAIVKNLYTKGILYLRGGDVADETARLMQAYRLRKGSVGVWKVDSWVKDEYFEGKYCVFIEK